MTPDGTVGGALTIKSRFAECSRRWAKALAEGARGPLIVAREIVDMGAEWTDEVAEAMGHPTYTSWLRSAFGYDESYFRRRAHAVATIGEHARRVYHHDAAVYVAGIECESRRKALDAACLEEWSRRKGVGHAVSRSADYPPLTKKQVVGVRQRLWNEPTSPKAKATCAECVKLRALLEAHGIEVE